MAISPLPTPPTTADSANFNSRADAFVGALPTFVAQTNEVISTIEALNANAAAAAQSSASDAAFSAAAAAGSAASAQGSASNALLSANNATAAAAYKGLWSSLSGALSKPASVSHNGVVWLLNNDLANVAASEPGVSADWSGASQVLPTQKIIENTTAQPFIHYLIASSAITLTLPVAPAVGAQVEFTNVSGSTGALIDPGSQLIRGYSGPMLINMMSASARIMFTGSEYGWV